ncbi:hypothetical protein Q4555_11035 [Octadecabacter sp. 1_MG-2023]|nr:MULTISPECIES: O-methyltransferase [unclassified Octadecabacter]MBU2993949.1 hypothetical protein [Octadecabacter sp. B2R22]MDO6735205.1 hypothetical protein [Octadecabacter sp. 1_MG-2023]
MTDHIAMYRRNGISKLYSFDLESNIVLRQQFNAPTQNTQCKTHTAAELPAKLNDIGHDLDIDQFIVWFDFTGARERGSQLADFQALLQALSPGDIARVALDASLPSEKLKAELSKEIQDHHFPAMNALLGREFGNFHPENFTLTSQNDMSKYLSACIQHLCDRATELHPSGQISYRPMLQTYYADSSPMFTVTILIQNAQGEPAAPNGFCYLATDWNDIENLEVPELTAREKSYLDRLLDRDAAGLTGELGYEIARAAQMSRQWDSFKKFHRFLPQFQHVELK